MSLNGKQDRHGNMVYDDADLADIVAVAEADSPADTVGYWVWMVAFGLDSFVVDRCGNSPSDACASGELNETLHHWYRTIGIPTAESILFPDLDSAKRAADDAATKWPHRAIRIKAVAEREPTQFHASRHYAATKCVYDSRRGFTTPEGWRVQYDYHRNRRVLVVALAELRAMTKSDRLEAAKKHRCDLVCISGPCEHYPISADMDVECGDKGYARKVRGRYV